MTEFTSNNQLISTYSIEEVRKTLEHDLDLSADRLRARLKRAWRNQGSLKASWYASHGTSVLRAGAR